MFLAIFAIKTMKFYNWNDQMWMSCGTLVLQFGCQVTTKIPIDNPMKLSIL